MAYTLKQQIEQLYIAWFNRVPDVPGLDYWYTQVSSGKATLSQVNASFASTPEAKADYPSFLSNAQFIDTIYMNVLERHADAGAITWLSGLLDSGKIQRDGVITLVLGIANTQPVDQDTLANKILVSDYALNAMVGGADFTAQELSDFVDGVTSDPATVAQAKVEIDGADAVTYALTTNTDTLTGTGGADVFTSAPGVVIDPSNGNQSIVDTLQSVDNLNGLDGSDTLQVTLGQATTNAKPTLANIENVQATFNAAGAQLNLGASTGVSTVTVKGSSAAAAVNGVGSIATLGVSNQVQNVAFDGSTATTLGLALDSVGVVSSTAPVQTVVDLGAVAASKATTLNITAKSSNVEVKDTAGGSVATAATIAATGANVLKLTDGATTIAALTVTGAGSVDVSGAALTAVKTVTAADGGLKLNATGNTATTLSVTTGAGADDLTLTGANLAAASTGGGADKVTLLTAAAATSTVDLGAGDDTLALVAASAAGATLTAGAGTDALASTFAIYNTISGYGATDLAKITGFEVLAISDVLAAASTVDLSKIAGLTSFQTAGVAAAGTANVTNVGANSAVVMDGNLATNNGALVVSLKDATGTSDVLNLVAKHNYTENNDATTTVNAVVETITASGVETINFTSTGKGSAAFAGAAGTKPDVVSNLLTLTDNELTTLNVNGDQLFSFTSTAGMTKLAAVNASANTAGVTVNVSAAGPTAAAITVTGTAKSDTLTGSANADTINGGDGNDTITGGGKGDTLSGGAGNDKFVFGTGDSVIGTGTFDTITGFSGNTWGNGTGGAAGTEADLTDPTKVTGDVLSFTVSGTAAAAKGIKVFVASSAADATTFLANTASADATQSSAALDSTTNKLYVDTSGDGVSDFYVALTGVTTLTAAAFEIN